MPVPERHLTPWRDAVEAVLAACTPLPAEDADLGGAAGRVLAEAVRAAGPLPPFASSAMDGYAVRSADLAGGPAELPVTAAVPAGTDPPPLPAGFAAPVATGAPVPPGADAVVPVEDASPGAGRVGLPGGVAAGRHVRPAGSDAPQGAVLVPAGMRIGPGEAAILAAAGCVRPRVHRRPRVAILSTGSELVPPDVTPGPAQIRESNSVALAAACRAAGAEVTLLGVVPDREGLVRDALARGLDAADVLVSSAGVSVGERDLVRAALAELGVRARVEAVALKPGKPLVFGVRGDTLVFGLPGNPASAQVGTALFVAPALRALAGVRDPRPVLWPAVAAGSWPAGGDRDHAVRVTLTPGEAGVVATPTGDQGSHRMASMVGADALALVPAGRGVAPGEPVSVVRLDG